MDAFLSTIEETIPQVLKASSLSTLSSSPCSPGGCTLSSVQLSFLPRGENDPSSPYSLSLSLYYQPWSDLNRSQKISFNHCWRGAVGRARTKSSERGERGRRGSYLFSISSSAFWYPVSAPRPHLARLARAPFQLAPFQRVAKRVY